MSSSLPTVSIVISAYNEINYLPATIDSILQQTCSSFEVLVFNNDFNRITRWFNYKQDSRFKFIFQENLGVAQTFNQGILEAQGEYICFIRAGDLWHPEKLQKQLFCLNRYPEVGSIHSWFVPLDYQGESTGKIVKHQYTGWVESEILKRNQISLPSVMLRRSCFETIGLFDTKLFASPDWDLWIRLSRRYQFMTIAEPLVYCRKHPRNTADNWFIVETDLHITIEKAFAGLPIELARLKHRSYGYSSLSLSQDILQDPNPDLEIALNYCRQALEHYLIMGLSPEFLQVRLAIATLSCWESDFYRRLLLSIQTVRHWFKETIFKY